MWSTRDKTEIRSYQRMFLFSDLLLFTVPEDKKQRVRLVFYVDSGFLLLTATLFLTLPGAHRKLFPALGPACSLEVQRSARIAV
jgi:hypothetical protein